MIKFTVPGRPVPAVRMTQRSKWEPRAQKYLSYKKEVAWFAKLATEKPIEGYVQAIITAYIRGKHRMDVDNIAKSILDGANGICYEDDRYVWSLTVDRVQVKDVKEQRVEVEFIPIEAQSQVI